MEKQLEALIKHEAPVKFLDHLLNSASACVKWAIRKTAYARLVIKYSSY